MAGSDRGGEANTAGDNCSERWRAGGNGHSSAGSGQVPRQPEQRKGSAAPEKGRRGQAVLAGERRRPGTAAPCAGEGTMLPPQPGPRTVSPGARGGSTRGAPPSARPSRGREAPQEARPTPAGVPRAPLPPRHGRPEPRRAAGPPCRAPKGPVPTLPPLRLLLSAPPAARNPAPLTGHGGVAAPPSLGQDGSRSEPNLRQRLYKVGLDLRTRRVAQRPQGRGDYKSRRAPRQALRVLSAA